MGRGLAALLSSGDQEAAPALRELAVELIRPNPSQPRQEFDGESLLALAESIKARGVLQPLVVRALPGGSYELVAGERRSSPGSSVCRRSCARPRSPSGSSWR